MRIATSTRVVTGIVLGTIVGLVVGIGSRFDVCKQPQELDVSPSVDLDLDLEPSSSSTIHEPPPPPEGPFYASLFVAGATWTLPCRFESRRRFIGVDRDEPGGTERCRVESVAVTAQTATARIGCWFEGETNPAVNTYVMTPAGLYMADSAPSTTGTPMFAPHPIPKQLPKRWGYDEPTGPTWAHAVVRHHGAWCNVDEFQSLDTSGGYTECISRHGIVGFGHHSFGGMTERCGDVP